MRKSVQSNNQIKSVIQTGFDIVKAHRGKLETETFEGEGTKFMITLVT